MPASRAEVTASRHAVGSTKEASDLELGRRSHAEAAWRTVYDSLVNADRNQPLDAEDVERLAQLAYMLGRDAHSDVDGKAGAVVRCCRHWLLRRWPPPS
jgi:hypothetical protein